MRELTPEEYIYLRRADFGVWNSWLREHPEVDRNDYGHDRFINLNREFSGIASIRPQPGESVGDFIIRLNGLPTLPFDNLMRELDMPELNSPVRFREGRLQEWTEEEPMPYQRRVVTSETLTEYKVTCTSRNNMDYWAKLDKVLREYAPKLKRNIYYRCPHGASYPPDTGLSKDTLVILFWAAPELESIQYGQGRGLKAFGYTLNPHGQDDFVVPTEEARAMGEVLADENGIEVIQVVGNTLYVLFDIANNEDNQTELMTAIMELYIISTNPEEVEMRKKVTETKAQARVGEVLGLTLSAIPQREIERETVNAEMYSNKVESYQTEMMNYLRKMVQSRQKIAQLKSVADNLTKRVERELKSLKKIKGVKRITTRLNTLRVLTDTVYIETEVAKYEIGEFALEFSQEGSLKIVNLTRKVTYERRSDRPLDHPHVRQGQPCWGNMSQIMEYVLNGEIAMAVSMTLEYMRNYTQGDAWAPLDEWPKVDEHNTLIDNTPIITPIAGDIVTRPDGTQYLQHAVDGVSMHDELPIAIADTVAQNTVDWRLTNFTDAIAQQALASHALSITEGLLREHLIPLGDEQLGEITPEEESEFELEDA